MGSPDGYAISASLLLLAVLRREASHRSVLVFAPHPDDELLMAAGVLQRALQDKAQLAVVLVTNGDRQGTRKGYQRMAETVEGLRRLGVEEDRVVFLGYRDKMLQRLYEASEPDFCFIPRTGAKTTYANRGRGRTDFHTSWAGKPAEYTRNNILADIRRALETFRPSAVFTASRYDAHPDHVATARLVSEALRALHAPDPAGAPVLYEALVHAPGDRSWPAPCPSFDSEFRMPRCLEQTPAVWESTVRFRVPSPELKYQAIALHASQAKSKYLAFARETERFWRYAYPYR